jgi:hypothetical protein
MIGRAENRKHGRQFGNGTVLVSVTSCRRVRVWMRALSVIAISPYEPPRWGIIYPPRATPGDADVRWRTQP